MELHWAFWWKDQVSKIRCHGWRSPEKQGVQNVSLLSKISILDTCSLCKLEQEPYTLGAHMFSVSRTMNTWIKVLFPRLGWRSFERIPHLFVRKDREPWQKDKSMRSKLGKYCWSLKFTMHVLQARTFCHWADKTAPFDSLPISARKLSMSIWKIFAQMEKSQDCLGCSLSRTLPGFELLLTAKLRLSVADTGFCPFLEYSHLHSEAESSSLSQLPHSIFFLFLSHALLFFSLWACNRQAQGRGNFVPICTQTIYCAKVPFTCPPYYMCVSSLARNDGGGNALLLPTYVGVMHAPVITFPSTLRT